MAKKDKKKSNVDAVLDEVMAERGADILDETLEPAVESIGQDNGQLSDNQEAEVTETAEVSEVQTYLRTTDEQGQETNVVVAEEVPSKLTVSVAAPKAQTATELLWKSKPAGELEGLLRVKAQHFAKMNYGINVTLTQVDQNLLDKCASDYRFAREIEKLTRKQ